MNELRRLMSPPQTAPADMSLAHAARKMERSHVGALVVSQKTKPIGMVTDRDIALYVMLEGSPTDTVSDCVSSPLISISVHATVQEAANEMRRQGIRRLILQDSDGIMVGVVSADDLLSDVGSLTGQLSQAIQREFSVERNPSSPQPLLGKE